MRKEAEVLTEYNYINFDFDQLQIQEIQEFNSFNRVELNLEEDTDKNKKLILWLIGAKVGDFIPRTCYVYKVNDALCLSQEEYKIYNKFCKNGYNLYITIGLAQTDVLGIPFMISHYMLTVFKGDMRIRDRTISYYPRDNKHFYNQKDLLFEFLNKIIEED